MSDTKLDNIIGVQVHKYLVGGITESVDKEGKRRLVSSNLAKPYLYSNIPPKYRTEIEEIIETIQNKMLSLGFSSSRFVGLDDLDNQYYNDDNLICGEIEGSELKGLYFPYNSIVYHPKNQWRFECLQVSFFLEYGIIPNSNHNIPRVLNIPRSNGTIQKAILKEKEGIQIKKTPEIEDLYVVVHFSDENPDEISELLCNYNKKVSLHDLVEINENIKEINIKFPQLEIENLNENDRIQNEVISHYQDKLETWKQKNVIPILNTFTKIKINLN